MLFRSNFRPKFTEQFSQWFSKYKESYWQQNSVSVMPPDDWQWRVLPLGKVNNLNNLVDLLEKNINITRVQSC